MSTTIDTRSPRATPVKILATGKTQWIDYWASPVCQVWRGHRAGGRSGSRKPVSPTMAVNAVTDDTVTVGGAEMQRAPQYGAAGFASGDLIWVVSQHVGSDGNRIAYAAIALDSRYV